MFRSNAVGLLSSIGGDVVPTVVPAAVVPVIPVVPVVPVVPAAVVTVVPVIPVVPIVATVATVATASVPIVPPACSIKEGEPTERGLSVTNRVCSSNVSVGGTMAAAAAAVVKGVELVSDPSIPVGDTALFPFRRVVVFAFNIF
jgi:hypothetical protein